MLANGLPFLRASRYCQIVQLAVLEAQFRTPARNCPINGPQPRGGGLGTSRDLAQFIGNPPQGLPADRLADGLLGFEELVDVGGRETNGLRKIRDRRLPVTVSAEMHICGLQDLSPTLM